ncbi:hypothetical protein TKK_0000453 [Trichogramma kaykai]
MSTLSEFLHEKKRLKSIMSTSLMPSIKDFANPCNQNLDCDLYAVVVKISKTRVAPVPVNNVKTQYKINVAKELYVLDDSNTMIKFIVREKLVELCDDIKLNDIVSLKKVRAMKLRNNVVLTTMSESSISFVANTQRYYTLKKWFMEKVSDEQMLNIRNLSAITKSNEFQDLSVQKISDIANMHLSDSNEKPNDNHNSDEPQNKKRKDSYLPLIIDLCDDESPNASDPDDTKENLPNVDDTESLLNETFHTFMNSESLEIWSEKEDQHLINLLVKNIKNLGDILTYETMIEENTDVFLNKKAETLKARAKDFGKIQNYFTLMILCGGKNIKTEKEKDLFIQKVDKFRKILLDIC